MKKALSQYNTVAGTTPAYTQAVPASAHKYAELSMLGGKTQPWNQLNSGENHAQTTVYGITYKIENFTITASGTCTTAFNMIPCYISVVANHKYLLYTTTEMPVSASNVSHVQLYGESKIGISILESETINGKIGTATMSGNAELRVRFQTGNTYNLSIKLTVFDLTAMFGSGNEPTSLTDPRIAQIKAYAAAHPEYNAGALVSAKVDEVKSVGANVWDEEWELGQYSSSTGVKITDSTRIRSVNYISVIPNTNYYAKIGNFSGAHINISMYDSNKSFIRRVNASVSTNIFTTDSNCYYITIFMSSDYGTTYNHDIQICLNSYAEKTTYHPYTASSLPIPTAVQNLDGYGQSAGTVYNYVDLEPVKYSNMKSVDLGSLNWVYTSTTKKFYSTTYPTNIKRASSSTSVATIITDRYSPASVTDLNNDAFNMCIAVHSSSDEIQIKDLRFTDAASFKAAMSGVILHYEATSGGSDYEAKLYHKRVGSVDLGSLTFAYHPASGQYQDYFDVTLPNTCKLGNAYVVSNIVCEKGYTPIASTHIAESGSDNNVMAIANNSTRLIICDKRYTSAESFNTAMNGVMLYYELASEQILDVTDLVNDYALLNIYDSGTVTFHQQGGTEMSVPNALYFATAQRTNGTTFGDANSVDDLALIQQSVSVQPALPKTNLIEIPGADGYIDLTEALGVGIKYNAREIVWQFALPPAAVWHEKQSEVSNAINGKRCRITLDNDPEWYYEGRITVEKYESDKLLHRISVVATCNPYKISKISGGRSL